MNFIERQFGMGRYRLLCHFLIFIVFLAGGRQTLATESDAIRYRIAIGDELTVTVFGHDDLSGVCKVDGVGRCSLPLINAVSAAGHTVEEFEQLVHDQLQPQYLKNPQVNADIVEYQPIYVLGEVRNPGSYPYTLGMNVVAAIAMAGGYTYRAARRKISLTRSGDDDVERRTVKEQEDIQPGDVIEVPERFF